jgi:hypothetical protein
MGGKGAMEKGGMTALVVADRWNISKITLHNCIVRLFQPIHRMSCICAGDVMHGTE